MAVTVDVQIVPPIVAIQQTASTWQKEIIRFKRLFLKF